MASLNYFRLVTTQNYLGQLFSYEKKRSLYIVFDFKVFVLTEKIFSDYETIF